MKKLLLLCLLLLPAAGFAKQAKNVFIPNMALLSVWDKADQSYKQGGAPYLAVFKKNGKTLVYLAGKHNDQKTLAFVDHAFKTYKPKIAVIEFERTGRKFIPYDSFEGNYTATKAAQADIPVAKADLAAQDIWAAILKRTDKYTPIDYQIYFIIRCLAGCANCPKMSGAQWINNFKNREYSPAFGPLVTEEQLNNWTEKEFGAQFDQADFKDENKYGQITAPISSAKYKTNQISVDEDFLARDPFMLQNITAALNKYKVVFAVFGDGHYVAERKVLEDMLGQPEYIWEVPFTVKEEVLVPAP